MSPPLPHDLAGCQHEAELIVAELEATPLQGNPAVISIERGDAELCDELGAAHATQIVQQIQQMITRDRRQHVAL